MIAADYSSADAKYAATTIVSTTLPPTRDVRALVAHRAPYVSRAAIASVRLLDPIAAFAIGDTSIESKTQRMANVVDMFRFADESSAASSSAVCASVEVEVLVELSELRQQVAHADRKAQLAAWFASSPMDGIGKFGFKCDIQQQRRRRQRD
jgi:hypothetical protein